MPTNKVLYYPDMEPSKFWFRSHLLFYDRIYSVIPNELDYRPSACISELLELDQNFFKPVAPLNTDKSLNRVNFQLFDAAFATIKSNPDRYPEEFSFEVTDSGINILGGATFLHDEKMSRNMVSLLKKHNFVHIDSDVFRRHSGINLEDFSVVNLYAANLIVSHIADNIGNRLSLPTITEKSLEFSINSLNSWSIKNDLKLKNTLASSIIQGIIPENITELSAEQFLGIREEYSDVRKSFNSLTNDLETYYDRIDSETINDIQTEIEVMSNDFINEVETIKRTLPSENIKEFISIFFGTAGVICSNYFPEPIRTAGSIASVILSPVISDKFAPIETEISKIQRRIGSLQDTIEWEGNLRQLLKRNWY
jgi:hypothetical protein